MVGLREKLDSSLGTAVTSQSNTSGPVPLGQINLVGSGNVMQSRREWNDQRN